MSSSIAATVTMIGSNVSPQDWRTDEDWPAGQSPDAAPNNDFLVPSNVLNPPSPPNPILRSPNNGTTATSTFEGNSLQFDASSIFRLKGVSGTTITVNDLRLNGGTLHNGNNNGVQTVAGNINVLSSSNMDIGEMAGQVFNESGGSVNQNRRLVIESTLSGSGILNIGLDPANGNANDVTTGNFGLAGIDRGVEITSLNNTFTGGWNVMGGVLRGMGAGSLGPEGDITVGLGAGFETDYDLSFPGNILFLDGVVNLDQNLSFGAITVAGTQLTPGTYDSATLTASFPNNFIGGPGSLTVIPEPGSLALAGVVLLGSVRRRRS
ncbi:MAG: PEP-CTERM sorting domain-containing protein [Verrucomicrobiales bacterium]